MMLVNSSSKGLIEHQNNLSHIELTKQSEATKPTKKSWKVLQLLAAKV